MTLVIAGPELHSYDGVSLDTLAAYVTRLAGDGQLRPLRGDNAVRPGLPGRWWQRKGEDEVRYGLEVLVGSWLDDATPGAFDPDHQARLNLETLQRLFGRSRVGPLLLARTDATGKQLTTLAEVVSFEGDWLTDAAWAGTADFLLHDWWRGSTIVDGPRDVDAQTDFVISHPGTARGHDLILTWDGPITNPRLTQTDTDIYVEALVEVPVGQQLVVNCTDWTALLDGASAIGSVAHSGDFAWLVLEPGDNPMRATAAAYGGDLTVAFRPPYY